MIRIYKNQKDIPQNMNYVELNDVFFNQNTVAVLDERASEIVKDIDGAELIGKYKIRSRFEDITLNVDRLSAGCKSVLNVLYFPEIVFCLKECGENALEILFGLDKGMVYSDYALIPFDMHPVEVCAGAKVECIDDYEALKEWWNNER